ncbi:MAG: hypothetical protein JW809_02415 [Pirellulales bacterium]|nr:hypothetical protein [Pirellulales bacterium]
MASFDGDPKDFDDLNLPTEEFESLSIEGMPDPTAQPVAAAAEPAADEPGSLDSVARKPRKGLIDRIAQSSAYTVMLALSLAFILLAIFCLFSEYAAYRFDRAANDASTISAASHTALGDFLA